MDIWFISKDFAYLFGLKTVDFECSWCRLLQKRVVFTQLDIYVFISMNSDKTWTSHNECGKAWLHPILLVVRWANNSVTTTCTTIFIRRQILLLMWWVFHAKRTIVFPLQYQWHIKRPEITTPNKLWE
jgi:hypothetical protein